jgi:hypothetical protein
MAKTPDHFENMYSLCFRVLGGYPKNLDDSPNTRERVLNTFKHKVRALRNSDSHSRLLKFPKIWIRLHVPSRPLLYGDEGTFTSPKHPQAQRIFLVWTHTRMSFLSNTFTSLPLVHTQNPDFLGQQLWLCFFVGSWMSLRVTPELGPRQIPESAFASSSVRECVYAWLPN